MTERLRTHPYNHGDTRRASVSGDQGLSTKKTMVVLVVVVGCFAVLWPKLFYPMLVNNANSQMKPGPVDKTTGCCDVISELDLDTIKIMSELCSTIIDTTGKTPPGPKEIVAQCRKAVLETCGIDISAALQDRIVSLGHSVKQILEDVRSLNGSLCLKYNFGLSPWRLGVPHRVNINLDPLNSIRQERPLKMKSEMVHPAFKERGRAIPQPDPSGLPRRSSPAPRIVEGRPGPIPGMRPAMGGPGHVVAPSKQSNYGFMGVLMPIYTIGFVVFFTYTIMKLVFKKKAEAHVGAPLYPPCEPDERFHKEVFEANKNIYFHRPTKDNSKIVVNAVSALLEEVNQELEARKVKMPETVHEQDEIRANGSLPKEDEQGKIKVMGMETTASSESGKKWSRPDSPVLPHPNPVAPKEPSPPPQQIFLEGSLPPQSSILVAESATETQKDSAEDDSPVVLAGKMTLSVISLDSETGTEESSNSCRKVEISDEERRTSSSNVSEEFEKINAADLEDQINNIIEEAENIVLTEENRYSLDEELDKFSEEIHKAPQINEKDKDSDVLEEIKNQLNLEDDLLLALKEEPEGKISLPVTDLIKEFLNNEENALLTENKEIKIDDIRKEDLGVLERDRRSLSEEKDGQELDLTEDLEEGEEILDIIKKEIENSPIFDEEELEVLDQQQRNYIAEEAGNLDFVGDEVTEEHILGVNIDEDSSRVSTQDVKEEAHGSESEEVKSPNKELDFEKSESSEKKIVSTEEAGGLGTQKADSPKQELDSITNLVSESEEIINLDQELKVSEEKQSKSELSQQNIATEDKVILEENLCTTQKVVELKSSKDDKDAVIKKENRSREITPEGSNKADLLLQGLMVKEEKSLDEQENIFEPTSSEQLQYQKTLDVTGTEIIDETDEQEQNLKKIKGSVLSRTKEGTQLAQDEVSSQIDRVDAADPENNEIEIEDSTKQNAPAENIDREGSSSRIIDEEGLIDDEDYDDSEDEELVDEEVREINREVYEDRRESIERRLNGGDVDSSRNGAYSETTAENEIYEEEDLENEDDDDEEIEEIIEYVDNTDDEGEEIIEINGNEQIHLNENGEN